MAEWLAAIETMMKLGMFGKLWRLKAPSEACLRKYDRSELRSPACLSSELRSFFSRGIRA